MKLDPNKVDENLEIFIRAVEAYNAEETDEERHVGM
jgi:hypothetical protein